MCGICGAMLFDDHGLDPRVISQMTDALKHRGPDSEGILVEGKVGIGVRRLSVIDIERGDQPIHNEDNSCYMIMNGEIYNYKELRRALIAKGHSFRSDSDTEVVVHSYEEYGHSFLNMIDGMFALCIWDTKNNQMLLARDRIGEKPLYYLRNKREFVFASEPKSILRYPGYVPALDSESVKKYFVFGYVPSPASIFAGIKKLPPATFLIVDTHGNISIQNYYSSNFSKNSRGSSPTKEETLRVVKRAVVSRLVSDVPIGVLLSGGVDSSLVAALMAETMDPNSIPAFTIGFRDQNYDESKYARKVASVLGLSHRLHVFSDEEVVKHATDAIALLDEPIADPSIVPTYLVCKVASGTVKVVLTGDGGDEIFGGYPKYRIHRFLGTYDKIPTIAKTPISKIMSSLPERLTGVKVKRVLSTLGFGIAERNILWAGPFMPDELQQLLAKPTDFSLSRILNEGDRCHGEDPVESALQNDLRFALGELFLCKVDRASMACSLEARVPFVSHELLEFAQRIPSGQKQGLRHSKALLKKIALDYLPVECVMRPKHGFGMPISSWIRGPLRELVETELSPDKIKRNGLLAHKYVESLLKDHFAGRRDNSSRIWAMLVFEVWLQKWILAQRT